jgi:hypothetical protein
MWTFEHAVECAVDKQFAWQFWTHVENWPVVDPAVESVTLDGAFAAGSVGITKPVNMEPVNWKLAEVDDGESAVVEIAAPGATARFQWRFADAGGGNTRITQRASIEGEGADNYAEFAKALEMGIPPGMQRLADAITQAATQKNPSC